MFPVRAEWEEWLCDETFKYQTLSTRIHVTHQTFANSLVIWIQFITYRFMIRLYEVFHFAQMLISSSKPECSDTLYLLYIHAHPNVLWATWKSEPGNNSISVSLFSLENIFVAIVLHLTVITYSVLLSCIFVTKYKTTLIKTMVGLYGMIIQVG